jgi:hypothetical protein
MRAHVYVKVDKMIMNPFTKPAFAADYETWYQGAGRRADQLEKELLMWLLASTQSI